MIGAFNTLLVSTVLIILVSSAFGCKFGYRHDCMFPCHCQGNAPCDENTGECPSRCATTALTTWTGPSCQTGNVAEGKQALQGPISDYNPDKSVDGLRENDEGLCSKASTSNQVDKTYWKVNLLGVHVITEIKLLNIRERTERPTNAIVYVRNSIIGDNRDVCTTIDFDGPPLLVIKMCDQTLVGDFVEIENQNAGESLTMCEVEVIGHLYRQCDGSYYGPGCHTSCNCNSKCDDVTGVCPTQCFSGKAKPDCQHTCAKGSWGTDCLNTCHCEVDTCNAESGYCIVSGCADGYTDNKCDWQLVSMATIELNIEEINGPYVELTFDKWDQSIMPGDGSVSFYIIQYALGDTWFNISEEIFTVRPVNIVLPSLRKNYDVRIMPYQEETVYVGVGIPTNPVAIYTDCADTFYGSSVCQKCNCRDFSEDCDKETGHCFSGCPDTHVGDACDVCIPTMTGVYPDVIVEGNIITAIVNDMGCNGNKDIRVFNVMILVQTRIKGLSEWHNFTTTSDVRTLETYKNINTNYQLRVMLHLDSELYNGYTDPSNIVEVRTECNKHLMGAACMNWCNCSDSPSDLCLLSNITNTSSQNHDQTQCVHHLPIFSSINYTTSATSITLKTKQINITEHTLKVDKFRIDYYGYQNKTIYCKSGSNELNCELNNLDEYTSYDILITPLIHHEGEAYASVFMTLEAKTTYRTYISVIVFVICVPFTIAVLSLLLYLVYKLKRRKDKIKTKQKYMDMCDLSKIDTTIDNALDEKIKQLPKYPDIVEYLLLPEDNNPPPLPLRKTTSLSNMFKINHCRSNGTQDKSDTIPPRLDPRNTNKSQQPTFRRIETLKKHGSDTKLTNSVCYSNDTFNITPSHDGLLKFNDLDGIPISIVDLGARFTMLDGTYMAFEKEYRQILNNVAASNSVSVLKANKPKNRYVDITPYDHSRVVLPIMGNDASSDYINASYIDGFGQQSKTYIATQAPKANTVKDMWRLIWSAGANVVVMLTNVIENGRQKSERYWPRQKSVRYGKIEVTPIAAEGFAYFVQRKFILRVNRQIRMITHLQFTSWPDHGVPNGCRELLNFYYKIKSLDKLTTGPWVLHCSAGIGRTGSLIAIDYLLEQAAKDSIIDVYKCISHMRLNRIQMVQTVDQYRFIYQAVLEALTNGDTGISVDTLCEDGCRGLINSELINNLIAEGNLFENSGESGDKSENRNCDRELAPIPLDSGRPRLKVLNSKTDYINAAFVDSYTRKRAFIVTQVPLQNTKTDFWRMVYEHECSGIVLLNYITNAEDIYWPEMIGSTMNFDNLIVRLNNMKMLLGNSVIERQFTITDTSSTTNNTHEKHEVCQWQVIHWPEDNNTTKIKHDLLLSVNEYVEKFRNDCTSGKPVVVQCLTGVNRSDLYVTLCYVLQKMSSDGVVDIPFAVRQIRTNRPQFMTSRHHIRHICDVVLALNSDNILDYANEW